MMIFWLRLVSISAEIERASRSVALPGAWGTMRRIGLSGNFPCGMAGAGHIASTGSRIPSARRLTLTAWRDLPWLFLFRR